MQVGEIILEGLMNKWNTIKSLIENKDFEGLQGILHDEYLYLRETTDFQNGDGRFHKKKV